MTAITKKQLDRIYKNAYPADKMGSLRARDQMVIVSVILDCYKNEDNPDADRVAMLSQLYNQIVPIRQAIDTIRANG